MFNEKHKHKAHLFELDESGLLITTTWPSISFARLIRLVVRGVSLLLRSRSSRGIDRAVRLHTYETHLVTCPFVNIPRAFYLEPIDRVCATVAQLAWCKLVVVDGMSISVR